MKEPTFHPVFFEIIVKFIVESKVNVMIIAVNKPEYFLSTFKACYHPLDVSPNRYCMSYWFLVNFPLVTKKSMLSVSLKYEGLPHFSKVHMGSWVNPAERTTGFVVDPENLLQIMLAEGKK